MPVRIECDGDIRNVKIIDVDSGVELQDDCTKVHIIIDAQGRRPEAIIHFTDVRLDVTGDVIKTIPPTGLTVDGLNSW